MIEDGQDTSLIAGTLCDILGRVRICSERFDKLMSSEINNMVIVM